MVFHCFLRPKEALYEKCPFYMMLFVYSACGEIRTDSLLPVLTAYFPVLAKGIIVAHCGQDGLTLLTGSSTRAGTGCTDLQLVGSSVADCQALT